MKERLHLLPLSLPSLWQALHVWDKSPWAAAVSLSVVVVLFVFLRWLNLTAGLGALRATRANEVTVKSLRSACRCRRGAPSWYC
jgi:hypothetical protein